MSEIVSEGEDRIQVVVDTELECGVTVPNLDAGYRFQDIGSKNRWNGQSIGTLRTGCWRNGDAVAGVSERHLVERDGAQYTAECNDGVHPGLCERRANRWEHNR